MNDKFIAGLATAVTIAPICAICVLGPAAVVSMAVGAVGWLGGAGPVLTIGLMAAAAALAWRTGRRRALWHRPEIAKASPAAPQMYGSRQASPDSHPLKPTTQRGHEQ